MNIPLVLGSALLSLASATEGLEEFAEEKVGGEMISCVCVSLLIKVNWGASNEGSRTAGAGGGACASVSFSFFLRRSLKGILSIFASAY